MRPRRPEVRSALLAAALGLGLALRLERALRHPDFFEDGYHHWWIAARLLRTGAYADPFADQVGGIWLPGYDLLAAGILALAGWDNVAALRLASVAFSGASLLLTARLAERLQPGAGVPAAFSFAVFPFDVVTGAMPLPEPLAVLLVLVATLLLLDADDRARPGGLRRAAGGVALALACLVRYEAWVVAALLAWHGRRHPRMLAALAPAGLVMAAWTVGAAVVAGEPFAARIYAQTRRELVHHVAVGFVAASPVARLATFARIWALPLLPVLALACVGAARRLRSWPAVASGGLGAAVGLLILTGVSSGSARYLALAAPFLSALAGAGLRDLAQRFPSTASRRLAPLAALALVAGGVAIAEAEGAFVDKSAVLHDPKARAGAWIARQEDAPGRLLVSESPLATHASGRDPADVVGSRLLPPTREGALAFLRQHATYVVYVDNAVEKLPFYRLNALFPELAGGADTPEFVLAHDPNGWERDHGAQTVLVYRVREAPP